MYLWHMGRQALGGRGPDFEKIYISKLTEKINLRGNSIFVLHFKPQNI